MKLTLQNLCISSIVESIDRYNHVYSTTDNKVLQQGFQILQKVYSEKLLEQLIDKELLKEEHAVLVFNKHLKSINTHMFSSFSWESIVETFSRIGPALEDISIDDPDDPEFRGWNDVICHLPNIKSISFDMYCNDSILKCVAEYCPVLEELNIYSCDDVTSDGIAHFCQRKIDKEGKVGDMDQEVSFFRRRTYKEVPCPLLKEITLDSQNINDDDIKQLIVNLPALEKLYHPRIPSILYAIHKDDLGSPGKIQSYNLTYLDLTSLFLYDTDHLYDDILKVCFGVCPNLKHVLCYIHKLQQLNSCYMLNNPEKLLLNCNEVSRVDVSDFLKQKGGNLTSLDLQYCTVSLSVLGQYCLRLNELHVLYVDIEYDEKDAIPVFDNLRTFCVILSNSNNSNGIRHVLRSSRVLRFLDIMSCESFSSEVMEEIFKCCEECPLEELRLTGLSAEVEILKAILETCSTLKHLFLQFRPGSDFDKTKEELRNVVKTIPNRYELIIEFCDLK